ncbi:MAG: DNA mismatch repair protein [Lachnospiraceae bacterium]|nr:DNA mismatch repair protein [Lachnospiraceae bacterium]
MSKKRTVSILFPLDESIAYHTMPDAAWHDLGMDAICEKLTPKANERGMIASVMRTMTDSASAARFRGEVFADLLALPDFRSRMMELLDRVQFLNDYGSFKKDHDIKAGLWELLHRLSELDDYIKCLESIRSCLDAFDVRSAGLRGLRDYIAAVYETSNFEELKKDISALKADTASLKSVTVGINLNANFEAGSIGIISVNNKEFKNSGILGNFADAITAKEGIKDGNAWNGSMRYHAVNNSSVDFSAGGDNIALFAASLGQPLLGPAVAATLATSPEKDATRYVTRYFDKDISHMLSHITRKLEQVLSRYVSLSISSITDLIPEFIYYIRWAEYIGQLQSKGFRFCRPEVLDTGADGVRMTARGIYNLKLAALSDETADSLVPNDLDFSPEHTIYLLTGANRGGKTTITQAVGLLYTLAQGGISVPGEKFAFAPVDCIYTHYPADEDKTMDLGRLGEECRRFKELYGAATENSLLLLNETFSTTSFEEGYFIAKDAVLAMLVKNARVIYNTHMHKLAYEIPELNRSAPVGHGRAASLVVQSKDGQRSFKVNIAPPEGRSYAEDIAVKYGVTYALLTGGTE